MKITLARGYVKVKKKALPPDRGESKRGTVTRFSSSSALRLSSFLAELVIDGAAVHACFTYPKNFPTCQVTLRNHLKRMQIYLYRQGFFGLWKKEYQKRGAIHYHLILWHKDGYDPEIHAEILIEIWQSIAQNDSPYSVSLTAGDTGLATFYLGLHHAKRDEQSQSGSGRWWGYIDRAELVKYRVVEQIEFDDEQITWLTRIFRRRMQARVRSIRDKIDKEKLINVVRPKYRHDHGLSKGFTLFLGQVDKHKLLRYLAQREWLSNITNSYQYDNKIIDLPITREMLDLP